MPCCSGMEHVFSLKMLITLLISSFFVISLSDDRRHNVNIFSSVSLLLSGILTRFIVEKRPSAFLLPLQKKLANFASGAKVSLNCGRTLDPCWLYSAECWGHNAVCISAPRAEVVLYLNPNYHCHSSLPTVIAVVHQGTLHWLHSRHPCLLR